MKFQTNLLGAAESCIDTKPSAREALPGSRNCQTVKLLYCWIVGFLQYSI